ncbi:hypothetical protein CU098_012386, partial [Rhizopus stolonifer]
SKSSSDNIDVDEWWVDFERTDASTNIPTKGKALKAWKLLVDSCPPDMQSGTLSCQLACEAGCQLAHYHAI